MLSPKKLSWTQKLYWTKLAKPAGDRELYRHLIHHPVESILQIGIGDGSRLRTVLDLSNAESSPSAIRFVGVDLFEGSPAGKPHLKLIDAHRLCAERGVKANLVPGELESALVRVAHNVQPCDLVIVSDLASNNAKESLARWLPRLVAEHGTVFAAKEAGVNLVLERVSIAQDPMESAA